MSVHPRLWPRPTPAFPRFPPPGTHPTRQSLITLQGESGVKLSAMETISQLGIRGMYRGTAACWLRDVPFSFVFFPLFANLKTLFRGDDSLVGLFAAGAAAGSLSAGAVTPCDVIKTRLQVVGGSDRYKGEWSRARAQHQSRPTLFPSLAWSHALTW